MDRMKLKTDLKIYHKRGSESEVEKMVMMEMKSADSRLVPE